MGKPSVKPTSAWTFEVDDKLSLNEFAARFLQYLSIDHHFAPSSLVVSLEAPFGSGKTTFLSMWANYLTKQREKDNSKPLPVLINAWKDDFCGDALLSLVLSLIEAVKGDALDETSNTVQLLKNALAQVAWFAVGLGNSVVNKLTGIDPVEAGRLAEQRTGAAPDKDPEVVKLFEHRRAAIESLRKCLIEAFGGDEVRAVVIVDELDRCRPDYAVTFLETIKHIFDIPGLVFVLAIDRDQLVSSSRKLFGHDLNANEYLRKFIARSFALPTPGRHGIEQYIQSQVSRFMTLPDVRSTSFDSNDLSKLACELCLGFQLTLRQIEEMFRIMGHVFSTMKANKRNLPSWSRGVLMLCALKVKDDRMYRSAGRDKLSTKEFVEFLLTFMPAKVAQYWGTLFHTRRRRDESPHDTFEHVWSSLGMQKTPSFGGPRELETHFLRNWGDVGDDHITHIYETIETAAAL